VEVYITARDKRLQPAYGRCAEGGLLAGLVRYLVDAKQFHQHDEDADAEVEIVRHLGAEGGRKGHASSAKREHERTFSLHDEISDPAVTCRDHQAK
jgi:hypothetical protein